ncbi:MAG: FMN-binding negative transcriptional regulator [Actinomycetota bacterium]
MLIRPHDAGESEDQWREFVRNQGFGHLAVSGSGDVPVVVPTQFELGEDDVALHLAKANPVFEALAATPRAVLSIAGDWAYVPGAWKAIGDEDASLGIPTTYYAAVQIIGSVKVIDDPAELAGVLRRQLADVEPADGGLQDPAVHEGQFRVIRGLRLSIDDVRTKFKYGGNADAAHRQAIAERMATRGGPGDAAAAARIKLT